METRAGLPPFPHDARQSAEHEIADTAFWVNVSRAKRLDISRDVYARLWVTPRSEALWEEMAREVYPNSDVSVSLRNRFYLDRLERFGASRAEPVMVNIAAGFTAYPFLLPENYRALEVDYPKVVRFKKEKVDAWMDQGELPRRNVDYHGADLASEEGLTGLRDRLSSWLEGRQAFVVLEGITYYLPRRSLDAIFAILADVLPRGSRVAFEHWPADAATYPVFARFKRHLDETFGWSARGFTLFDRDYPASLPGFSLIEELDSPQVERLYSDSRALEPRDARLPAFFKTLERI